jgi:hypothetical protein
MRGSVGGTARKALMQRNVDHARWDSMPALIRLKACACGRA